MNLLRFLEDHPWLGKVYDWFVEWFPMRCFRCNRFLMLKNGFISHWDTEKMIGSVERQRSQGIVRESEIEVEGGIHILCKQCAFESEHNESSNSDAAVG